MVYTLLVRYQREQEKQDSLSTVTQKIRH